MRPKKVILCLHADEAEFATVRCMLTVHGYRVLSAATIADAEFIVRSHPVDLVLADATDAKATGLKAVEQLKRIALHLPMMILGNETQVAQVHMADAMLIAKCPPQELLERIKIMAARKRGPRKGTPSPHENLVAEVATS